MYGMMMVDICTGLWLLIATTFELPVSTTHSCVGAIVGMSIAMIGADFRLLNSCSDVFMIYSPPFSLALRSN
jgi:phosphate/sulfate permease